VKLENILESRNPIFKVIKDWMKVSDLLVDMEDELIGLARTDPKARQALEYLRNNDFQNFHQQLRKMSVFPQE